jgi:hypothetical protein
VKHSFVNPVLLLAQHHGQFERNIRCGITLAANGTDGPQFFEMPIPHGNYPIITVGQQGGRILPTGDGIGATHEACEVMSFARAAGIPPINTVVDPIAIIPGPPGTHDGSEHGAVVSVTRAAGKPPIRTVGCPLIIANGSAGCGAGVATGAAGWIGAWQCGALCST